MKNIHSQPRSLLGLGTRSAHSDQRWHRRFASAGTSRKEARGWRGVPRALVGPARASGGWISAREREPATGQARRVCHRRVAHASPMPLGTPFRPRGCRVGVDRGLPVLSESPVLHWRPDRLGQQSRNRCESGRLRSRKLELDPNGMSSFRPARPTPAWSVPLPPGTLGAARIRSARRRRPVMRPVLRAIRESTCLRRHRPSAGRRIAPSPDHRHLQFPTGNSSAVSRTRRTIASHRPPESPRAHATRRSAPD